MGLIFLLCLHVFVVDLWFKVFGLNSIVTVQYFVDIHAIPFMGRNEIATNTKPVCQMRQPHYLIKLSFFVSVNSPICNR